MREYVEDHSLLVEYFLLISSEDADQSVRN